MKTLKQIVNDVAAEIGLPQVTTVAGNTDTQTQQLLALLNREGKELSAMCGQYQGWPSLRKEYNLSFVASQGDYALPTDLYYFIHRTGWDTTRKWQLAGPMSPQEWRFLKSGYPASGFLYRYRIMGGRMYFDPVPTGTDAIVFEYYSKNWVLEDDGTTEKEYFTEDTDTPILDDFLLIMGTKWRFLRAKGMSYDQEYNDYQDTLQRTMARSADARTLNMGRSQFGWMHFIDGTNVPDTGIG